MNAARLYAPHHASEAEKNAVEPSERLALGLLDSCLHLVLCRPSRALGKVRDGDRPAERFDGLSHARREVLPCRSSPGDGRKLRLFKRRACLDQAFSVPLHGRGNVGNQHAFGRRKVRHGAVSLIKNALMEVSKRAEVKRRVGGGYNNENKEVGEVIHGIFEPADRRGGLGKKLVLVPEAAPWG